ncbi:MAG TPA: cysteine--tRNA ligase [Candidatus Saccharimonadales bacterium]|nr:cysteine--tRNA ligase [Candidatus Saccharimonadales bacterium]
MKLYNSLTRKIEEFKPINPPNVGMYTCGMTVYDYAHIGHGRKYVNDDILKRTLTFLGYKVKHVQNVTDVGHLVSDADEGDDKLEKGATKLGKTVWEVAEFFTNNFYESMDKLNIIRPDIIAKATDNIPEQIELIKKIIERGYAYDTPEAVYFDVAKFEGYGSIFGQNLEEKKVAVREKVKKGDFKKNPADFALWFKRVGHFKDHTMHWDSPWGDGFPGWHIECSAMSIKYLGEQFDIHTGGEDHLSIHHPNEIAQSEAATGKIPFVKYWVHTAFLLVDGVKMSKSLGNFYTVDDVIKKGFDPISLRYFYLGAHYKKPLNFTWEALEGAQNSLNKLRNQVQSLKGESTRNALSEEKQKKIDEFRTEFTNKISDDLNTPEALAVVWSMLKSNIPSGDKYDLALTLDEILGLGLSTPVKEKKVTTEIKKLLEKRENLRKEGKYDEADKIRDELVEKGYTVSDAPSK